jgi:hypothetical protein
MNKQTQFIYDSFIIRQHFLKTELFILLGVIFNFEN